INLGRLVHAAGNPSAAEAHYRAALEVKTGDALAAFTFGVALEDQGKTAAAAGGYRLALAAAAAHAEAPCNLWRLLEAQGDLRSALRHLSRFRRLMQNDKGEDGCRPWDGLLQRSVPAAAKVPDSGLCS